ncbi:hypothetical protein [Glycomyces sp. NRRL B-16210]|uniref:hypothetical protein n=1 Tax=Glycomyces sp. NRRL B-16210 TaxID=1463821 RepID=UPI0010608806|nr:hypothetical protein [Glycomyces sp. NRRL B-16210]
MAEATPPEDRGTGRHIDLGAVESDGVPAPEAPRPPERRRFPFLRRHANTAMAIAAVALVIAAAVATAVRWAPFQRPPAEAAVLAFLEAAQEGDVEAALALTDETAPSEDFLVPEALDDRWSIVTVAQVDFKDRVGGTDKAVAQVYAEIEAFDGTRIGARYRVVVEGGEAVIDNGLTLTSNYSIFDDLGLNGVSAPAAPDGTEANFALLPGLYELYRDLPSTMEFEESNLSLALGDQFRQLGSDWSQTSLPISYPVASDEGRALVDELIADHYDACAADPSIELCPFAFPEDPARDLALAPGATWEVVSHPQVEMQWNWYGEIDGSQLLTTVPGEARAPVVVTEDGREREATVSCSIWTEGLYAEFDLEGRVWLTQDAGALEDQCRSLVEVA